MSPAPAPAGAAAPVLGTPLVGRPEHGAPPAPQLALRYNFAQSRRLSPGQLRVLSGVHTAFAQSLAVALSARLRQLVDVVPGEVQTFAFSDYVAGGEPPAALFVAAEASGHRVAIDVAPELAVYLVERLLGGGEAPPSRAGRRPLSLVEQHLAGRDIERSLASLAEAWSRAAALSFGAAPRYEATRELSQIAGSAERIARCAFAVRVQGYEAPLAVCYPVRLLENLLDRGAQQRWQTGAEVAPSPAAQHAYEETLHEMPLELRAVLGRARVRVRELDGLAAGDVLALDTAASAPVTVTVRGRPLFTALPGRSGERLAVRVLHVISPPPSPPDSLPRLDGASFS